MDRYYKPVRNFSSVDHKANNQSYCAFSDHRGVLYFGEALGLKVYDANNWKVIGSCGRVLSGAFDSSGVLFVGSQSDFGYHKPDNKGNLKFVSLAPPNMPSDAGFFWFTICTPGKVYFVSNNVIYVYDYHGISAIRPKNRFHKAFHCNGKIFVKEFDHGLFYLKDKNFVEVPGSEIFDEARIDAIMPYQGDTMLLASRELGMMQFVFNGGPSDSNATFLPINTPLNELFESEQLNSGIPLPGKRYAFGTKKSGVYLADARGQLLAKYNSSNGLISNTVWGITTDAQAGLWIALDNGISRVEYDSPFTPLGPEMGYSGNIETINKLGEYIYLGSTTGLHRASESDLKFSRVGKITEPCWNLAPVSKPSGKSLLVSSDKGLFEVDSKNQLRLIAEGNFGCAIQLPSHQNLIVAGTPSSVEIFRITGDQIVFDQRIPNLEGDKKSIEQDIYGNIWIGTSDRGVLFISGSGISRSQYHNFLWLDQNNGLPSVGENNVFSLFNKIYVSAFDGLFELNGFNQNLNPGEVSKLKFRRAEWLPPDFFTDKLKDDTRQVWTVAKEPQGPIHLSTRFKNNFVVAIASIAEGGKYTWETNTYKCLPHDQIRAIYHANEKLSFLGGAEFLFQYDRSKKLDFYSPSNAMVRLLISQDDTLFFGDPSMIKSSGSYDIEPIPYQRELTFCFANTFFSSNLDSEFSTLLEGEDDDWTSWSKNNTRTISKLWPGDYTLKLRARNPFGVIGKEVVFRFRITPPWYLTWWAFSIYSIAIVFSIISIIKIYTIGLNRIIRTQTIEIVEQKNLIENKNKEITDSIWYAKRIQDAIMPSKDYFTALFPRSFIILKPKDIVSGDFYWATEKGNERILVAADCTGHGVPGAFMSMMGIDYLNDIVIDKRITNPDEVLNSLRSGIIKALKQKGEEGGSKDGMDISMIRIKESESVLDFAGANNPLYLIRANSKPAPKGFHNQMKTEDFSLFEFKGNKFPVGIHYGTGLLPFTSQRIDLLPGDRIYLFSDGYADQFGGPDGKKLKNNQFKKFLLLSSDASIVSQHELLLDYFSQWKGSLEQVDDILVLGFEI